MQLVLQLLGTGVMLQMPCPTFTDTAMIRNAQADTVSYAACFATVCCSCVTS